MSSPQRAADVFGRCGDRTETTAEPVRERQTRKSDDAGASPHRTSDRECDGGWFHDAEAAIDDQTCGAVNWEMFAAFEFDSDNRSEHRCAEVGQLRIESEWIDQITTAEATLQEHRRCDRRAGAIGIEPEVGALQRAHAALVRTLSIGTISAHS
jgi:hypothetical protein